MTLTFAAALLAASPSARAEWGWFAAKIGGGYSQPVGGINSRLHGGFDVNGGAGANLGPYFSLMTEYNFMYNGFSDRFAQQNSLPGGNLHMHTLNPVLHFAGDRKVSPYITGGFGWYHRTVQITLPTTEFVTVFDPFWGAFFPAQVPATQILSSYTVNKGGWNTGWGFRRS